MNKPVFAVLRVLVVLSVFVSPSMAPGGEVGFAAKPAAVKDGSGAKISFAASAAIDVEVAVLQSGGKVVRHLGAGLLGPNAPEPFQKNSLKQEIAWDGKDDAGKPVSGPSSVRVRLGLGAELDRFIPASPSPFLAPSAIGVGPDGNVYVLSSQDKGGGSYLYVLDREGKYLRTILPSPAGLKKEQVKGLERLTLADGSEVPVIYSAFIADFAPHLAGFRSQQLAVSKDGWIVFASGGNNWADQIVPRHALVIKPDGTTPPEVGFVGPALGPYGRYSSGLRPQQIALSPDGKTLYFAGMGQDGKTPKGIHCIGRTTWDAKDHPQPFIGKPDESGSDETHLNNPISVATDAKGNLYVVDTGNGRVVAFDPEGKYQGETQVPNPGFVCVHPKSGALYVGTAARPLTGKHEPAKPYALVKFDKAAGGKEVARYEFSNYRYAPVLALDAGVEPPKLWMSYAPAYGRSVLVPITDAGEKLTVGDDVLKKDAAGSIGSPLFMSLDARRERLYVVTCGQQVLKVDLKSDQASNFLKGSEAVTDSEGNLYVLPGYGSNALLRYDPEGKPLPFAGTGSNKIEVQYRAGGPNFGVRGLTVAPNGDIYAYEEVLKPEQLHVFSPDGKLKKQSLIQDIPVDAGNGVAVDRAGNVYAGVNVHDPKKLYPDELLNVLPPYAWERTYRRDSGWYNRPQRKPPEPPWSHLYLNNYLYFYGCIFKFPPAGGRFWTGDAPPKEGATPRPEGVPAAAVEYRTGLLGQAVWCQGALWNYRGFALCGNRSEGSGDPTCSCFSGRFCLDEHERLFVPDVFRSRVTVLDTAGNELARIGNYGNVDSAGPKSLLPEPKIPLAFPNAVAAGGEKAYILDRKNRRVVVVKLTHAAEEVCEVK